MITLYLIRHGETLWNRKKMYQGTTDVALSEKGLLQAKLTAERFKDVTLDGVYSSPLSRARTTAEGIAKARGLSVVTDERLSEISFGEWEGKNFEEIEARWPGMMETMFHDPEAMRLPGGETFAQARDRTVAAAEDIFSKGDGKSYVIASHGAAIRTLLCGLLDIPLIKCWNFDLDNASVTELHRFPDGMVILHTLNDTVHLKDMK